METKCFNTQYGRRTFSYAGPRLWNALPLNIRTEVDIEKFKRQIKSTLFDGTDTFLQQAFNMKKGIYIVKSAFVQ